MTAGGQWASVMFHDAECGGYSADLPVWAQLASAHTGLSVCDLGAGTGRVALALAAAGHDVTAVEAVPVLADALRRRAAERGLGLEVVCGDAVVFERTAAFGLTIAPMQLVQLIDPQRLSTLIANAAAGLRPGGELALAVLAPGEVEPFDLDGLPPGSPRPLADVREHEGWVFASTPTSVRLGSGGITIGRRREVVSPDGAHEVTSSRVRLWHCEPAALQARLTAAGLEPLPAIEIAPTHEHHGSSIVRARLPGQ